MKILPKSKYLLITIFLLSTLVSKAQLYRVSNEEKAVNSSLIIEGKVVAQKPFWNPQHTLIFTSNTIQVTKLFKGFLASNEVEIVTTGGSLDGQSVTTEELLQLQKGDVGIFFCFPNQINLRSPLSNAVLLDVYASSQGNIVYDKVTRSASTPFERYANIERDVYPEIVRLAGGANYRVIDNSFNLSPYLPNNNNQQARVNAPTITGFSPTSVTAGATSSTLNELTITGTEFGVPGPAAYIAFDDANNGTGGATFNVASTSSLIVSWTDTEIKVKVPSRAGTGSFSIVNSGGEIASTGLTLDISYSILSSTFNFGSGDVIKQSNLMNANGAGGYDIVYSTNTNGSAQNFDNSNARVTFQRALNTWREVAGVNFVEAGTTLTQAIAGDNQNVIMFDNANTGTTPMAAGTLGICYSFNSTCTPSTNAYQKAGFDIVVRNSGFSNGSTSFEEGPCAPVGRIDLETVLFHEIGHALNLGHINDENQNNLGTNPAKVMNFSISTGTKRTAPDLAALNGALYTGSPASGIVFGNCNNPINSSIIPLARVVEAKDECPLSFPTAFTQPGTIVSFDLAHATSNKKKDPQFTAINCAGTGTGVTNTAFYALRTSGNGTLDINVSDFVHVPTTANACPGQIEMALYETSVCPNGQAYPLPIACRTFSGDGALTSITGLTQNTTYLLMVDGQASAKATFKLTLSGQVLPVVFGNFTGVVKGNNNELNWQIASYTNVAKIQLEKSANGSDFNTIQSYNGSLLNTQLSFTHNDSKPFAGKNYYRLAVYNQDGSVQYSNTVVLERKEKLKIAVLPNPVVDNVTIQLSATIAVEKAAIKVYNAVGQLVLNEVLQMASNTAINKHLNTANLPAGNYRIIVIGNNNEQLTSVSMQKL